MLVKDQITNAYRHKNLLYELVINTIKKRYRRSVLGVLWSMLNPLMTMGVQAFVFSNIFRSNIENYLLYLITGQILFNFFCEGTNMGMSSIIANAALIKKVRVPKYMFPFAAVMSSCVNLLFSMPALIIIMLITKTFPTVATPVFILPLLFMLVFCMGVSLILSTMAVFFRDILHLWGVFLTLLNYATPIFYSADLISDKRAAILRLNPLYHYIKAFRAPLYGGVLPPLRTLGFCAIGAVLALAIGTLVFRCNQKKFILYV